MKHAAKSDFFFINNSEKGWKERKKERKKRARKKKWLKISIQCGSYRLRALLEVKEINFKSQNSKEMFSKSKWNCYCKKKEIRVKKKALQEKEYEKQKKINGYIFIQKLLN